MTNNRVSDDSMPSTDSVLLRKLQIYFVKDKQTAFSDLTGAINGGDFKLARRIAHGIKGSAGQIGEHRLQEIAAVVEAALAVVEASHTSREASSHTSREASSHTSREASSHTSREAAAALAESSYDADAFCALDTELASVLKKLSLLLDTDDISIDEKNILDKTADADVINGILKKLEPMLINRNPECLDLLDEIRSIPDAGELVRLIESFKFKQALDELAKII